MPALSVQGLRKTYGAVEALRGVDLEVAAGTVLAVTGPSASGKTTLLRVLGGDESADAGRITVDGRVLADERIDVDPRDRPMAAVPQGGGLLADRNAGANIALSLPRRVRNSRRGAAQVAAAFDLVGLGAAIADRRPGELSISERQRVALARALIGRPTVLLLDEPFYAFDPATRARFRADLRGLLEHTRTATVLVSHDAADVVELAHEHRALVDGRLEAPR